jgi:hypothetical protein
MAASTPGTSYSRLGFQVNSPEISFFFTSGGITGNGSAGFFVAHFHWVSG